MLGLLRGSGRASSPYMSPAAVQCDLQSVLARAGQAGRGGRGSLRRRPRRYRAATLAATSACGQAQLRPPLRHALAQLLLRFLPQARGGRRPQGRSKVLLGLDFCQHLCCYHLLREHVICCGPRSWVVPPSPHTAQLLGHLPLLRRPGGVSDKGAVGGRQAQAGGPGELRHTKEPAPTRAWANTAGFSSMPFEDRSSRVSAWNAWVGQPRAASAAMPSSILSGTSPPAPQLPLHTNSCRRGRRAAASASTESRRSRTPRACGDEREESSMWAGRQLHETGSSVACFGGKARLPQNTERGLHDCRAS